MSKKTFNLDKLEDIKKGDIVNGKKVIYSGINPFYDWCIILKKEKGIKGDNIEIDDLKQIKTFEKR